METWLHCTIMPGQFSTEYTASGDQADGEEFALFAPSDLVEVEREPTTECSVEGKLRVELWGRKGDMVLIRLPQPTVDGRQYITVRSSQLETKPSPVNPVNAP